MMNKCLTCILYLTCSTLKINTAESVNLLGTVAFFCLIIRNSHYSTDLGTLFNAYSSIMNIFVGFSN